MKLTVRIVDAPAVNGGKALVLCDEHGEMLPNQQACAVSSEITDCPVVTARFFVDGDRISLVG